MPKYHLRKRHRKPNTCSCASTKVNKANSKVKLPPKEPQADLVNTTVPLKRRGRLPKSPPPDPVDSTTTEVDMAISPAIGQGSVMGAIIVTKAKTPIGSMSPYRVTTLNRDFIRAWSESTLAKHLENLVSMAAGTPVPGTTPSNASLTLSLEGIYGFSVKLPHIERLVAQQGDNGSTWVDADSGAVFTIQSTLCPPQ